jgi:hypothetical protein
MDTLTIFLKSFLQNIEYIIPILLVFSITSICGFVLYKFFIDEENLFVSVPAGIITGVLSFILFLGILSYVFKGILGILIILIFYILTTFYLNQKAKWKFSTFKFNLSPQFFIISSIYLFYTSFFLFTSGNNVYGGDVIAYWGFATSFANGNYPLMSPWQPDLLAAHHQGSFLYEGAVFALSHANIRLIHSLYSFLIISAGFFLLWGWIRKQTKHIFLSLIPALVFYISFGAFFTLLPIQFSEFLFPEVNHEIQKLPIMTDFKNRLGGSSNLNEIFYINHRATAFAGMLLIFIIVYTKLKVDVNWKYLILACLAIPTIASDEVVFPALGFGLLIWWINSILKMNNHLRKKTLSYSAIALVVFIILFFISGSALRDAMLIPAPNSRFTLITNPMSLIGRFNELAGAILTYKDQGLILYLPDLRITFLLTVFLSFLIKNRWSNLLLFASIGTFFAMLFTEHTYYPGNHGRFLHLMYLLISLSLSINLLQILTSKQKKRLKVFALFILAILIMPGIFTSQLYLLKNAKASEYPNFDGRQPDYKILAWAQKNIPSKRIFFLDGYLKGQPYSYLTLVGIQNYGLKVPVSPAFIKVHTPDYGIESFDVINFLDPESLKDLKVDYVFITNDQVNTLPAPVIQQLKNSRLFRVVYSDELGKLYLITGNYTSQPQVSDKMVKDLKMIIPQGSKIYLDAPPQMPMATKAVLLLALQNIGTIYTLQSSGHFNYIETDIKYQEPDTEVKYHYLILDPKTDPYPICLCSSVEKFWEASSVVGYKTYD